MSGNARGAIAIWSAFVITLLLAVVALVLNAGHITSVKGELQNGVDAAALAGALQLRGTVDQITPDGASPVVQATRDFASYHYTDKPGANQLDVPANRVLLGEWRPAIRPGCEAADRLTAFHDSAGSHFCEVTARDGPAAFRINAVYARAERAAGSPGGPVPVFLSAFLGRGQGGTVDQAAEALALSGGPIKWEPSSRCVPMVIGVGCLTGADGGACASDAPPDSAGPMYTLGLASSQVRSAGWSVFTSSQPSDTGVCDVLTTGTACVGLGTYIQVNVGQGNMFNGGCGGHGAKNCDVMKGLVGQTVDVPSVSLSGDLGEACPSNYTGNAWVVGYTTLRILAVNCTANVHNPDCVGAPCTDASMPCSQFASGKCMLAQVVCNHQSGTGSGTGGAWTGSSTYHPVLVQTRGASN